MKLTQEQLKANIDAMTAQGAKPEQIQGWLNSLKEEPATEVAKPQISDVEKTAGVNYLKSAWDAYSRFSSPEGAGGKTLAATHNFLMDIMPGKAVIDEIVPALYASSPEVKRMQNQQFEQQNQIQTQIINKYLKDPNASIEMKLKGTALLNSLSDSQTNLYETVSGVKANESTMSLVNRALGASTSDVLQYYMLKSAPLGTFTNVTNATGALAKAKALGTGMLKGGGIYGSLGAAQSVAQSVEKNKPAGEVLPDAAMQGLEMGLLGAGFEGLAGSAAIGKNFLSKIKGWWGRKGVDVEDLTLQISKANADLEATIPTSKEMGTITIDATDYRAKAEREALDNLVQQTDTMAADATAPKVVNDVNKEVEQKLVEYTNASKKKVNVDFFENPILVNTETIPTGYYGKLQEIQNTYKGADGWESLVSRAKKWYNKNTTTNAGMVEEAGMYSSLGQDAKALALMENAVTENPKTVKDLIYTKEGIDSLINYSTTQGVTNMQKPLVELQKAVISDIETALKGTDLAGQYEVARQTVALRKTILDKLEKYRTLPASEKANFLLNADEETVSAFRDSLFYQPGGENAYLKLQMQAKREAIESAKDAYGVINHDIVQANIKKLSENRLLSNADLADLQDYLKYSKYIRGGAKGEIPTGTSGKPLSEEGLKAGDTISAQADKTAQAELAAQTVAQGKDIAEKMAKADMVIDNIVNAKSADNVEQILKALPTDIKEALPKRIWLNATNDAIETLSKGSFDAQKMLTYFESIGFGKGNKKAIVEKLIPNAEEREVFAGMYKLVKAINDKPTKSAFKKMAHLLLGSSYLMTGARTPAANQFVLSGIFPSSNIKDVAPNLNKFIQQFGLGDEVAKIKPEVVNKTIETLSDSIMTNKYTIFEKAVILNSQDKEK